MPSTVMKAYCEPSIVLCSIGTKRKVQDMIPTYEKAHTLAGGVRQESNQRMVRKYEINFYARTKELWLAHH